MQSSSYPTRSLPDVNASPEEDEEDDEDYDGYGDYVYDVADKLRDVNARLRADATPVDLERPRKVQFRDDPVETVVCFSSSPDDICYLESDFISAILHDGVQTSQDFEMGSSTIMTDVSSVNDAGDAGYEISKRRDSADDTIEESLDDLTSGSDEQEPDGGHETNAKVSIEGSVPVLNGGPSLESEQDYSSDDTGSNCESVTEELVGHDSAGGSHPDVHVPNPQNGVAQPTPYHQLGGTSVATPCSSVPSTSSSEDICHQENVQDRVPRKGQIRRKSSSADVLVRPKALGRCNEPTRPRTSPSTRSKGTAQTDQKKRLPQYVGNTKSIYGLTKEAKEELALKKREERLRHKQKELQLQKEREERKYEAKMAFQAWLEKKRQKQDAGCPSEDKKASTKDEDDKGVRKEESQSAFEMWLERKRIQKQEEELYRRLRDLELSAATPKVSREDAEKAYARWLKKKEDEERQKKGSHSLQPRLQRYSRLSPRSLRALERYLQSKEFLRYPEIIL